MRQHPPPEIEQFVDRLGTVRLYYRNRTAGSKRIPLRGPIGSPEFWEDYNRASKGSAKGDALPPKDTTLDWLIAQYYRSGEFIQLRASSKQARTRVLNKFADELDKQGVRHGEKRYKQLEQRHLRKFRNERAKTPEAANNLIKYLRQVFKNGVECGFCETNPTDSIAKLKPVNADGFHSWTIEEVETFEKKHPIGTTAHLAMTLMLYWALRRSDVVKVGPQHLSQGWLTFRQTKTGREHAVPLLTPVARPIEHTKTGHFAFLITSFGKPFTAAGFGNKMRKWCNEAGLPHCSAHGLRKASAARLAELGLSAHQIMSITGHTSLSEVERYTRKAQKRQLAAGVRDQLEDKFSQTIVPIFPNPEN